MTFRCNFIPFGKTWVITLFSLFAISVLQNLDFTEGLVLSCPWGQFRISNPMLRVISKNDKMKLWSIFLKLQEKTCHSALIDQTTFKKVLRKHYLKTTCWQFQKTSYYWRNKDKWFFDRRSEHHFLFACILWTYLVIQEEAFQKKKPYACYQKNRHAAIRRYQKKRDSVILTREWLKLLLRTLKMTPWLHILKSQL